MGLETLLWEDCSDVDAVLLGCGDVSLVGGMYADDEVVETTCVLE